MEYKFEPVIEVEATDVNGSDYRIELPVICSSADMRDLAAKAKCLSRCFGYEIRWDQNGFEKSFVLYFKDRMAAEQFQSAFGGQ